MSARRIYDQPKPIDKAPNGVEATFIYMGVVPPGKDKVTGLPRVVHDKAPPQFHMILVDDIKVPCYQGKVSDKSKPKTLEVQQYYSDALIELESFDIKHKVKSFAKAPYVPGCLYRVDSFWYSNFLDKDKPENGMHSSFMTADLAPHLEQTIEDFVSKAPFENFAIIPGKVRTSAGYVLAPEEDFVPEKIFVAKLLPTSASLDHVLAEQAPGTVLAWIPSFIVERQQLQIADQAGVVTPCVTFGKEADSQLDLQVQIYQKNPDGSMFTAVAFTRFYYLECLRGYQLTPKQWYALGQRYVPEMCGTLISTVKAFKTSKFLGEAVLEDNDGVCVTKSVIYPDVAHVARTIGVPVPQTLAKRIFDTLKVQAHMVTEVFNVRFANAFNLLTVDGKTALKCLAHPGMRFYLVTDHQPLDEFGMEAVGKLTEALMYDAFIKGVAFPGASLGYKVPTVPNPDVPLDPKAPKYGPGAIALYAAMGPESPGFGKPLSTVLDPPEAVSATPKTGTKRSAATAAAAAIAAPPTSDAVADALDAAADGAPAPAPTPAKAAPSPAKAAPAAAADGAAAGAAVKVTKRLKTEAAKAT